MGPLPLRGSTRASLGGPKAPTLASKQGDIMEFRKFDIGASLAILLAIIGGVFWLGQLDARIDSIDKNELEKKLESALSKIELAEKSITDQLPVGTVVASVLEPKIFLSEGRNERWHLADRSSIPIGSAYEKLVSNATIDSKDRLPDLRGVFLRGINSGRSDSKQDPEGDKRVAGSYQSDQFRNHDHSYARMQGVTNGRGARTHMGTSAPVLSLIHI